MLQTTSTAIGKTHVDRDTNLLFSLCQLTLPPMSHGYRLPAVFGTTDQTGAWDTAGRADDK